MVETSWRPVWKTKVWKFKTRANGVDLTINRVQITYSTLSLHDRRVTKHSHEKILTAFTMFPTRQNMGENNGGGVNQDWENWPQKKCAIVHSCSERGAELACLALDIATVSKMASPQCLLTLLFRRVFKKIILFSQSIFLQMNFLITRVCRLSAN